MVAKSVVAPVDRIKILYQVSSRKFHLRDVPRVALKIMRTEGFTALWKGNTATMIRVFPYSGIQFMVFDRCKTAFLKAHEERNDSSRQWGLSPLESLLCGSFAGICSAVCTYPLDMTRAQLAVLKRSKHVRNLGFVGVLAKNYKERVCMCVVWCVCVLLIYSILQLRRSIHLHFSHTHIYIYIRSFIPTQTTIQTGNSWFVQRHYTHNVGHFTLCRHCLHPQRTSETTDTELDRS